MIHQPLGGASGQTTDVVITAENMVKLRKRLAQIIADRTGKSLEEVQKDIERDLWLTAEESKTYGLIDKVLKPKNKPAKRKTKKTIKKKK